MTIVSTANVFFRNRFAVLFVLLFCVLLIPPYFEDTDWIAQFWRGLFTLVLLWALYSAVGSRRALALAVLLLLPTLVSTWLADPAQTRVVAYIDNITNIAYFGLICAFLGQYVLRSQQVTVEVIFAAMCLYMILAILWAAIFTNIELFYREAFLFQGAFAHEANIGPEDLFRHMTYYSFVTLSTLGYGDIIPANLVARNWAAMEAMIGQFFIAIVIARLVSIYTLQASAEQAEG
ncbi:MAG: potassium channel family protein [Pseudomonadota bacterium]